jgi:pimeloyl-ACP methyl ester carboxylesterase
VVRSATIRRGHHGSWLIGNRGLVHGGFVDGSGWQGVDDHLKNDGYNVAVVQNPTMSLEGDVAATNMITNAQDEPVILVGHSYGGAVITEAGTNPNVMALVYIAAFAPDKGESVNTLIADPPPGAPVPPILPPRDGFLFLDREKFHASFRERRAGRIHGRLASSLGRRGAERDDHRAGMAEQAKLVPGHH